jgi:hypothetical protein
VDWLKVDDIPLKKKEFWVEYLKVIEMYVCRLVSVDDGSTQSGAVLFDEETEMFSVTTTTGLDFDKETSCLIRCGIYACRFDVLSVHIDEYLNYVYVRLDKCHSRHFINKWKYQAEYATKLLDLNCPEEIKPMYELSPTAVVTITYPKRSRDRVFGFGELKQLYVKTAPLPLRQDRLGIKRVEDVEMRHTAKSCEFGGIALLINDERGLLGIGLQRKLIEEYGLFRTTPGYVRADFLGLFYKDYLKSHKPSPGDQYFKVDTSRAWPSLPLTQPIQETHTDKTVSDS